MDFYLYSGESIEKGDNGDFPAGAFRPLVLVTKAKSQRLESVFLGRVFRLIDPDLHQLTPD